MSSFDNAMYQSNCSPSFSVAKLNYSVNQDEYVENISLINNFNTVTDHSNTNNNKDTSHTTNSGDESYPAHSPLNNSDLNQHGNEKNGEYLISTSDENSNTPSNDSSSANLLNMNGHYNTFYSNINNADTNRNYEDGYSNESGFVNNLMNYNGFNFGSLPTSLNGTNGILNLNLHKPSASTEQSFNNSSFNMINLIKEQQTNDSRKTNSSLELPTSESSLSNGIEEVIESVIGKANELENEEKGFSQNEFKENIEARLQKDGMMHLMQPPDSETIAAATEKHKLNRTRRRTRTKYDDKQLDVLESTFQVSHYPEVSVVDRLSSFLKLSPERIAVWFQNRRARFKRAKKSLGAEENPPNITEASMLREVEELLFSSYGKSTLNNEQTASHLDNHKKRRPGKKSEYETLVEVQDTTNNNEAEEENTSSSPDSNINGDKDDERTEKSPTKNPEIIIEAIVKPNNKHKPIFNPMSYEPSHNIPSNNNINLPYSTYNPQAFSVNNLMNSNTTNNDYYSYGVVRNESAPQVQLKLPIYRKDSQDSYSDSISRTSSRSLSPQNDQDLESNTSQFSSQDSLNKDENHGDYGSSQSVYSNHQYGNNQNGFYQQQNGSSSNMAYYNYPYNHNSNFLQSYYNMTDFQNHHAANAYIPNMYSQFSSNPIATTTYN